MRADVFASPRCVVGETGRWQAADGFVAGTIENELHRMKHARSQKRPFFISDAKKKISNWNLHRSGDSQQRFNRNDFFSTLNFANIFWVQFHDFSQSFLCESGFFSVGADGVTNFFSMH